MGDHRERRQAHRRTGDYRRQQSAEDRIQHADRNRHADQVVDKGEEQVLTDVAKRCPRWRDRLMNAGGCFQRAVTLTVKIARFDYNRAKYPEVVMSAKRTVPTVVDATTLKMSLGSIGERVRTADLQITKHGTPQAVVISVDRYHRLTRLEPVDPSSLEALQQEFDDKLARMQSAQQGVAMNRLMDADEDDIKRFLSQHYNQNPVPPMVKPAEAFATGSKRVVRSKPFNAIQVLTVPALNAKRPISERLTVVETKPRKQGGSASGAVIHHKAGKILSVAASAATATKPRKRAK